ncbi:hypothetical protein [Planktothrix agardhii]|uniref:hypothetical protein n=1 Tax=Planktothrix agardhii TaxID=1160 RepID=UPI001BA2D72B|nr:hypothetical protein [Planktothrix agardhii]CAD0230228.1 hypothetical protein PL10110_510028 [Planktothrix agardhii]CAD5915865.1 hypothetical protein NO758_00340 [Planktothrix agardhii]
MATDAEKEIKERKEREEQFRISLSWWGTKIVSILIMFYLLWSVFASEKYRTKSLSNQDIALICVVLLFNAGIIDKLTGFSIEGGKIEAKFETLEEKVDQNKEDINDLQQKQIDEIESLQRLLYQGLLNGYEYWTLFNLDGRNNGQIKDYHYSTLGESQLRNLYSVNFIDLQKGKNFHDFSKNEYISFLRFQEHFIVTQDGKNYLDQMKKMGIVPKIAE